MAKTRRYKVGCSGSGWGLWEIATGRKVENVYLDNLISVIGGLVERTDNYQQRVEEEYGLI